MRDQVVVALADQRSVALVEDAAALADIVIGELDIVRLEFRIVREMALDSRRNVADPVRLGDLDAKQRTQRE